MFTSPVMRRYGSERAWTEHLATTVGALALLESVARAPLPEPVASDLDEVVATLAADVTVDELGFPVSPSVHHAVHQLHVGGRFPDVAVHDARGRLFALVEAQRRRVDDRHIAKLAARYLPESGARLGVLVAERWDPAGARHPAWRACPVPVAVVVAYDGLHEIDYQVAWAHVPAGG